MYDLDMPSLTPKVIDGNTYYYARYCQRVGGKPKIVRQVYLGKIEDLVAASEASRHLCNRRVGIRLARTERQPRAQRRHRHSSRPVAIWGAVVVDQPRLHNGIAHTAMVAARQNVVVAQQVLPAAVVLNQRPQRPAAAVRNGVSAGVKVVVVAAGTAQRHQRGQLSLVGRV